MTCMCSFLVFLFSVASFQISRFKICCKCELVNCSTFWMESISWFHILHCSILYFHPNPYTRPILQQLQYLLYLHITTLIQQGLDKSLLHITSPLSFLSSTNSVPPFVFATSLTQSPTCSSLSTSAVSSTTAAVSSTTIVPPSH